MAQNAKIRTLTVRPSISADLSFNMAGIISGQNEQFSQSAARIGSQVVAYDAAAKLYPKLGDTLPADTATGRIAKARLQYDSQAIRDILTLNTAGNPPPYLFSLRNEPLAASLDQAIVKRERAFLEKYLHANAVTNDLQIAIPQILDHLEKSMAAARERFTKIDQAYNDSPWDGVQKTSTTRTGYSKGDENVEKYRVLNRSETQLRNVAMVTKGVQTDLAIPKTNDLVKTIIKDKDGNIALSHHETTATATVPQVSSDNTNWSAPLESTTDHPDWQGQKLHPVGQEAFSETKIDGEQISISDLVSLSYPRKDNEIAYRQVMMAGLNEELKQKATAYALPYLVAITEKELQAIDLEIRALQLNYIHTFLLAPFDGLVTAIYKDRGESVSPGEPVMRVESNDSILLVGDIGFRGLLKVGTEVNIVTKELFTPGQTAHLTANVVAIRGHDVDNDVWNVILKAENTFQLPSNYQFDPDHSHIEI